MMLGTSIVIVWLLVVVPHAPHIQAPVIIAGFPKREQCFDFATEKYKNNKKFTGKCVKSLGSLAPI